MGINCLVFSKKNSNEYLDFLRNHKLELDIYYYPNFLKFDAEIQKGDYEIFVTEYNKNVFIFPYIKLYFDNIEFNKYYDISSPYGYCGPYCTSENFFLESEKLFYNYISEFCVTLFVRYHYLYNHQLKFRTDFTNIDNRTIVTLNLKSNLEDIWSKQFSTTNRNLIRKMEKENYFFSIQNNFEDDIESFIDMYYSTMSNANANSFYYFDRSLLQSIIKSLDSKIVLAKITKDDIVYSSALFFISSGIATYYLSARNLDFPKIPSTNYLIYESIKYFKKTNTEILNLGGGLTNDLSDFLFKFKSNFSKDNLPFVIGKKINNKQKYNQLIELYIQKYGNEMYSNKKHVLQFYRN